MKIVYAGSSDVGRVRDHNEDSIALLPEKNLAVVCDGMGGHAAGEVASQIGIETITKIFKEFNLSLFANDSFKYPETITPEGKLLVGAIAVANQRIVERGKNSPGQTGMGTTVIACQFGAGVATICHVGDSRAYLIRDKSIKRISIDHSWVSEVMEKHNLSEEESENLVNRNVITRALGTKPAIRTDISQIRFLKDDLFLLCSDGLTGMVGDSEILKIALANFADLDKMIETLIAAANEAGGLDNISICVAKVLEHEEIAEFDEVRRVTVDWGEEAEMNKLKEIAREEFPPDTPLPQTVGQAAETTGYQTFNPKKKRIIRGVLLTLLGLAVIFVIVVLLFQSR